MLNREQHVGVASEPRSILVEQGFLRLFAKATGESNPIYFDDDAARGAGHCGIPMPPTYLFSLALGEPAKTGGLFDKGAGIGLDMAKVLHAEQEFVYHRLIFAGDRITMKTITSDIYSKKGGALEFVVQDTSFENQHGDLCATMRFVTAVRNG